MTQEQFKALSRGDLICHKGERTHVFVVDTSYGDRVTATRTADVTNPEEWEMIAKADYITTQKLGD